MNVCVFTVPLIESMLVYVRETGPQTCERQRETVPKKVPIVNVFLLYNFISVFKP